MNNMYEKLQFLLELTGNKAFPDSSELHGVLCAHALQAPVRQSESATELARWLDIPSGQQNVLTAALDEAYASLLADDMSYQLYLPNDAESLMLRTDSLAAWCGGFVSGMGVYEDWLPEVPQGMDNELLKGADEAREAISDLSQIARADLDSQTGDEAEEQAYAEIMEYVRVAVQVIQRTLDDTMQCKQSTSALH